MKLFELVPEKFFNILTSKHKNLYVDALFVLRAAFKLDSQTIRRSELVERLVSQLESSIQLADFTEEMTEEKADITENGSIIGRAKFIVRQLLAYGWIEIEYEKNSFVENITIPDYSILLINLLYDLTHEKPREYNGYVYSTYTALKSADDALRSEDSSEKIKEKYLYEALNIAYENTEKLVDELKILYQNIRRYAKRAMKNPEFNALLEDYFDHYRVQVFEAVYFPLKTTDSIPLFKNYIINTMSRWSRDDIIERIVEKSRGKHADRSKDDTAQEVMRKILFIAETYESIEEMMDLIDLKHEDYSNAAIERMRYILRADTSAQSRIAVILDHASDARVRKAMNRSIEVHTHGYMDRERSLYTKKKKRVREAARILPIEEKAPGSGDMDDFLSEARRRIGDDRIDAFVMEHFGDRSEFETEDVRISSQNDFIMFILSTIRGQEMKAPFRVRFLHGDHDADGSMLPRARFIRKRDKEDV